MRTLLLILAVGCGRKAQAPETAAAPAAVDPEPVFVTIDMSYEDDELGDMLVSELMLATAECGNLQRMEPSAMLGRLTDAEIRCLDDNLQQAERQTHKDKVSRVLMADAWAKKQTHRWEAIVRRHLDEIDRSDPDLCYALARHLAEKGGADAEVGRWADVALENRTLWTGDLHVSRVYALYRLKAIAAQRTWSVMEADYVSAPSDDLLEKKEAARNVSKTLAREWLEYARSAGRSSTDAYTLCVSAAGTKQFCDEPATAGSESD